MIPKILALIGGLGLFWVTILDLKPHIERRRAIRSTFGVNPGGLVEGEGARWLAAFAAWLLFWSTFDWN